MRFAGLFFFAVAALQAQPQASLPDKENGSPFLAIPQPSEGLRFQAPLPAFEAKDIAGRTWRLEDLRGKWTLIYVWGTLEARRVDAHAPIVREVIPDLSNLPEVQRFYTQTRQTKNIQVLTFCGDYDYTHAPQYVKEKQYSFPVIADWKLVRKLFPEGSNPPYAIVDADARLSYPLRSWSFGRVLLELDRAAVR